MKKIPLRFQPKPEQETRFLLTLNVMVVLVMLGMGMVAPILPLYGKTFGVSTTLVGFLITSFGLARMIMDLPAGILSEKYGRRIVLIGGPLLMAAGSLFCAVAGSFWELTLWRFLQGAGSAMYTTAAMTAVADLSTTFNRARNMALYQGSILIGAGLGPALGGLIAGRLGYRAPFFIFALLAFTGALWVWLTLPETQTKNPLAAFDSIGEKPSVWALIGNLNFFLIGLVNFGVFFTRAGANMDLVPLMGSEKIGLNPEQLGFILALGSLGNFAVLPLAGWLADRYGRKLAIVPANLISGLALLFFASGNGYWLFLLGVLLYGISSGLGGTTPAAYVADIVPRHTYGLAMGLLRTFGDVGFVAAPIFLGWLTDLGDYRLAFWFNAFFVVASSAAFGVWGREEKKKENFFSGQK